MARNKVTVIGAGNVGATTAQRIAEAGLADVVLVDIVEGLPQGKGLDLAEAAPVVGHDARIIGTNDYADTAGSDIVVVTVGPRPPAGDEPRRPAGQERRDRPRGGRAGRARTRPTRSSIIVTNPLDAMCHVAMQRLAASRASACSGMAGVLDSARFRTFIAQELGVSVEDTHAFVLGGHGDTMVPLSRYSTVAGVPITELLPPDRVKALEERTANGGAEVVALLKTGSAFYAPAASTFEMVESILLDRKRVLPCAVLLQGEFRTDGLSRRRPGRPRRGRHGAHLRDRADGRRAGRLRRVRRRRPGAGRQAALTAAAARQPGSAGSLHSGHRADRRHCASISILSCVWRMASRSAGTWRPWSPSSQWAWPWPASLPGVTGCAPTTCCSSPSASVPGAVIGGRLGYVLLHLDYYTANADGHHGPGAGVAGAGARRARGHALSVVRCRPPGCPDRPLAACRDAAAPVRARGWQAGHGPDGSGQGQPSDLSWATAYPGAGPWGSLAPALPSHPAQVYEGIATLVILVVAHPAPGGGVVQDPRWTALLLRDGDVGAARVAPSR